MIIKNSSIARKRIRIGSVGIDFLPLPSIMKSLDEMVDDGVTGLLFQPGNAHDLQAKVRYLWERPELCEKMGQAGSEKALCEYSAQKYYKSLMATYEKAMQLVRAHRRQNVTLSTH